MNEKQYLKNLTAPEGKVDFILDTDAFNEIDDLYAVSYILKSPEKFNVVAITAAPFFNDHSTSPKDGMEKSFEEIKTLIKLIGIKYEEVYKGSDRYFKDEKDFVKSAAAEKIVEEAGKHSPENPLYIGAIGAITNVASALNMAPEIADKVVIIWLGGHSVYWRDTKEFNMHGDIAAARTVFLSAAPLVQFPCMGVVSELRTTKPELKEWLCGVNPLCTYLYERTVKEAETYSNRKTWSRVIWDITVPMWFDKSSYSQKIITAPLPGYDDKYTFPDNMKKIAYIDYVDRDGILENLFEALRK